MKIPELNFKRIKTKAVQNFRDMKEYERKQKALPFWKKCLKVLWKVVVLILFIYFVENYM